jgi:transcriptional adapter 2-alpha
MVFISPQEEELCRRFNINHKQYMMIKETIIRESVKQGVIERDETAKIFKIERNIVDGVFDFLVEKDEIVASIKDDSDE